MRKYGTPPFKVVVVHGGPGAAGEMKSVAKRLASNHGVLEPLQTATSISGQCEELKIILETVGDPPYILIGHSWGAMLSFIFAATYPEMVKKLILVSSGPFLDSYAATVMDKRFKRCSLEEKQLLQKLLDEMHHSKNKERAFLQLGKLLSKVDSYDSVSEPEEDVNISSEIYERVWREAHKLRKSGGLIELGEQISCPVVAIHGDYDSHPVEGVRKPLSAILGDFRFILLKNCGHTPWREREAKEKFFNLLEQELH